MGQAVKKIERQAALVFFGMSLFFITIYTLCIYFPSMRTITFCATIVFGTLEIFGNFRKIKEGSAQKIWLIIIKDIVIIGLMSTSLLLGKYSLQIVYLIVSLTILELVYNIYQILLKKDKRRLI
jgi:hypothetical protein